MRDAAELFASDVHDDEPGPVTITARFNGVDYRLGRAVPVNALATEVVELLRHLADEIEAVGLMREAKGGA